MALGLLDVGVSSTAAGVATKIVAADLSVGQKDGLWASFGSIWLVLLISLTIAPAAAQEPKKTNIVFMLTDNLGYGELGVYAGYTCDRRTTPQA